MGLLRHGSKGEYRPPAFVQCPGCSYDFVTGEGARRCTWYECPYLPEEYKVLCPVCNHNFATGEGATRCTEPPSCEWSVAGYQHARLAKKLFGAAKKPAE